MKIVLVKKGVLLKKEEEEKWRVSRVSGCIFWDLSLVFLCWLDGLFGDNNGTQFEEKQMEIWTESQDSRREFEKLGERFWGLPFFLLMRTKDTVEDYCRLRAPRRFPKILRTSELNLTFQKKKSPKRSISLIAFRLCSVIRLCANRERERKHK